MSEGKNGVFENLPRRRPALRTPRRDRRRTEFTADEPQQASFAATEPAPEVEEHHQTGARRRVEDLTLSSISAAADAVVLGLKLIERGYGGVRGTVKRH